jgi:hypothetical protein
MSQRHEDPDFLKNAETAANEAEDRAIEHIGAEVVSQAVEFLDTHSDRVDKEVRSVIEATAASNPSAEVITEANKTLRVHSLGEEASRFVEATAAADWARSLDESFDNGEKIAPHPGQTPIAYSMSKAISGEARQQLVDQYVNQPETIVPPGTTS